MDEPLWMPADEALVSPPPRHEPARFSWCRCEPDTGHRWGCHHHEPAGGATGDG